MDRFASVEDNENRLIGKVTMLILSIVMTIVVGVCIDDIISFVVWNDMLFIATVIAISSILAFLTIVAFLQTDFEFFIFFLLEARMWPYVTKANEIMTRIIDKLGIDPHILVAVLTIAVLAIATIIVYRNWIWVD